MVAAPESAPRGPSARKDGSRILGWNSPSLPAPRRDGRTRVGRLAEEGGGREVGGGKRGRTEERTDRDGRREGKSRTNGRTKNVRRRAEDSRGGSEGEGVGREEEGR
ncbi:hypothetical protein KM043_007341 [Ampulex compressa]|nr:hypothetical protein KM043_007341 [Ampulex compressa]